MKIKLINARSLVRKRLLVMIMKTFIFLLCTTVFSLTTENSFSQEKVTIDKDQLVTVDQVFKIIKRQTDYRFIYPKGMFKNTPKIQLKKGEILVTKLIKLSLSDVNLDFELTENNTIVFKKKVVLNVSNQQLQQISITGTITDNNGQPLLGANIVEKGTANGTQSDIDGNFSIIVSGSEAILVVSYIGYLTQEINTDNQNQINIQLIIDTANLDEIILIGYGSQSKTRVTGSISKLDEKIIERVATGSFEQAILGKMAGVLVTQNGNNPGEDSEISIRGIKTLTAGTNPLIVVDGVPLSEGSSLSSISTNDIASITVLKDAASAAIYGSRASNGVILITTKKGKEGKLKVTFDTYYGTQSRSDRLELSNAYETAQFFFEARNNGYVTRDPANRNASDDRATRIANGAGKRELILAYTQPYLDGQPGLTDFNWLDAVYRDAPISNYHVTISGGTPNTDYYASFGYFNQEGLLIGSDLKRYTSNIRLNTTLTQNLKFGVNINTSISDVNVLLHTGWGTNPPDPSSGVYLMYPFFSPYNADGSYAISEQLRANIPEDGALAENVIAQTLLTKNFEKRFRLFGSAFLEFEPIKDLKLKSSFGGDFRSDFKDFYTPSTIGTYRTDVENNISKSSETNVRIENYIIENTINYSHNFDKHNIGLLLGQSYQEETFASSFIFASGIVDDNLDNIAAGSSFSVDANRSKWTQLSYFGRIQYDFDNRYQISAAYRRDGSSRFGENSKWGTFSSLSGGWIFSNETFFPKNSLINFVKLRASWGETGNNQIGTYSSQALVEDDNYTINGQLVPGFFTSTSPNLDLSWESTISKNFGLDLGFFNNRITFTAEHYISNTEDLLLEVPVPQQSGFSNSLQNIGEVENKGWEFQVNSNNFKLGQVSLSFNANLTTNSNKVISLGEGQDQIIASSSGMNLLTKVGEPVAQFYGYDILGVFKSQAEIDSTPHLDGTFVGDYVVRDVNGDGAVNSDDRIGLGTFAPDFSYGFGLDLGYKNFDLSFSFNGIEGRKILDWWTGWLLESGEAFIVANKYYIDNYYDPVNNPDGFLAAPNMANFSPSRRNTRNSSITVKDADYLRLRNIQLGYTFSPDILKRLKMSNLRVYVSANNLFTITKYLGPNPEATTGNVLLRGAARSTNAIPKSIYMGLSVAF